MKIAGIVDEFSALNFENSCQFLNLDVYLYPQQIEVFFPDLLFVESAWFGYKNQWHKKISHYTEELDKLITLCKSKKIPTVFFNKEDPYHFHRFLITASNFDYIFTTDINSILLYRMNLKSNNIFLLPFGINPLVHNPRQVKNRLPGISFAGSYYKKYEERSRDFSTLVNAVTSVMGLTIFDRYFGIPDENYSFPKEFKSFINGSLSPSEVVGNSYKAFIFGLNLNTIKNSESMFARRVLELLACGTIVVSNASDALNLLFPEIIISSDHESPIIKRLKILLDDRILSMKVALSGVRKVLLEHTFQERILRIRNKVFQKNDKHQPPLVSIASFVSNSHQLDWVQDLLSKQTYKNWKCTIFYSVESFEGSVDSSIINNIEILQLDNVTAKSIRNFLPSGWLSFFDCRSYYGPNYLLDLILATKYSDLKAFGKPLFFECSVEGIVLKGNDCMYKPISQFDLSAGIVLNDGSTCIESSLSPDDIYSPFRFKGEALSLDCLSYCRNVLNQNAVSIEQVSAVVDDLEINQGSSIDELYAKADALRMAIPFWIGKPGWKPEKIAQIFGDRFTRDITGSIDRFGWHIISELRDGDACVLFSEFSIPVEELGGKSGTPLYLEAGVGLQMQLLVRFEEASGALIDEAIFELNTQNHLSPPDSCTHIRLGYRITSSGSSRITRLVLA